MVLSGHTILDVPEQALLVVTIEVPSSELGRHLGPALKKTLDRALARGASPGPSVVRRLSDDGQTARVEAGICVAEEVEGDAQVQRSLLPGTRAIRAHCTGPYDRLDQEHRALQAWATSQGLTASGAAWEVHLTDPGDEPDPNRAEAQLYLPIKP